MKKLLAYFLDLCLLRSAPQDLPASRILFGLTLLANLGVTLLLVGGAEVDRAAALWQSLLDTALMLAILYLVLRLRNWTGRFLQTATALLGSSALLGILTIPAVYLSSVAAEGITTAVAAWLLLLLIGWSMLVGGHILRHALEVRLGQGVLIAVLFQLAAYALVNLLIPVR